MTLRAPAPATPDHEAGTEARVPRTSEGRTAPRGGVARRIVADAGAAALVVAAWFLPIWHARVMAPQYPGGLGVSVRADGLHGDVAEINELNHYIGMDAIDEDTAPELGLWGPTLGLAFAAVVVATLSRRTLVRRLARLAVWGVVPGILVDIQFRLWQIGHNLDPAAALRMDLFTPLVVGPTTVWNFKTWAYPGLALGAVLGAAALLTVGARHAGGRHRRRPVAPLATAALAAMALIAGGSGSMAQAAAGGHGHHDGGGEHTEKQSGGHHSIDTVAARIAAARPGDVVEVSPGCYHGTLVITKPVTLAGRGRPALLGDGRGDVVTIAAPDVTIRDLDVGGSGEGPVGGPAGIRVAGPRATIRNVSITDSYHGIAAVGVEGLRVEDVTITGRGGALADETHAASEHSGDGGSGRRGDGISLVQTRSALVRGATVHDVRDGIYLSYADEVLIDANAVHHSRYGLHAMFARDYVLAENQFERNGAGIVVMYGEKAFLLRNDVLDHVSPSTGFGLIAKDVGELRSVENRLVGNRIGLQVDGPAGSDAATTQFVGNTVARNTIGVALMPTAAVTFTRNRFAENLTQVLPLGGKSASRWAAKGVGNFWSSYRGFDRRGDGIGDVAHAEPPAVAEALSREPMLAALATSPGLQLLSSLRGRWAQLDPVLVDELPLMRPDAVPGHHAAQDPVLPSRAVQAASALVALLGSPLLFAARRPSPVGPSRGGCMPSLDGRPMLEAEGLGKRFGPHWVLRDVSFAIPRGTLVWVEGGNGAGKSTLLRCLAGLSRFVGSARFDGRSLPGGTALRRRIAYLPQAPGFLPSATVGETLRFFARLRGDGPADLGAGFLPPPDARIGELSGGQRKRVALAVALAGNPDLLLLDEPVANLDPESLARVRDALLDVAAAGGIVLVASPTRDEVTGLAERVLTLSGGGPALAVVTEELREVVVG